MLWPFGDEDNNDGGFQSVGDGRCVDMFTLKVFSDKEKGVQVHTYFETYLTVFAPVYEGNIYFTFTLNLKLSLTSPSSV